MGKVLLTFRVDGDLLRVLIDFSEKTMMSVSEIIRRAVKEYLNSVDLDEEQKKVLKRYEAKLKREENRELLRTLTLIHNQLRLIEKLRKQGLEETLLNEYIQALREEAELRGMVERFDAMIKHLELKVKRLNKHKGK